jgi:Ca2+/Na+ antiporter
MSDETPKHSRPTGWAVSGCLLTSLIWLFAAFVILGIVAGDCFPELGTVCPSDHERNMRVLLVALATTSINILGLFLLARAVARRKPRD